MLALLQFDATSFPVVERLLQEGRLPALAELVKRGQRHALGRSTPLFVEAGSYVSLYSGSEVGDHGIYSAFQWSAADQRIRFMDAFPRPTAVWDRVARANGRSLVVDPYEGWPPDDPEGLRLLNGWQFKHKLLLRMSKPRGAQTALALRLGPSRAIEHQYGHQSPERLRAVRGRLLDAPARAAAAAERLISRENFDLVWITFSAAHFAGHYYWDLSETLNQRLDDAERGELEATVGDSYAAVDAAIGRVVAALPSGADVIVLSPIGMSHETSRSDLLPDMVRAVLGKGSAKSPSSPEGADQSAGSAIWRLRADIPWKWRNALARPLPGWAIRDLTARLHLRGTDWPGTRAFALPGDHAGYVRLNVRGREREGVLDPDEADAVMDELVAGLSTFRDPDGAACVERVDRVKDEIEGALVDQLPDLVVRWSDRPSPGPSGVHSPRHGDVARRGIGTGRSGNHTAEGWAIIVPGASRMRELEREPRLTDIAATACRLSGADESGLAGEALLDPA